MNQQKSKNTLFIKSIPFFIAFIFVVPFVRGQETTPMLDSDLDGVTDLAEDTTYKTDKTNWDTDGDGFSDSIEVLKKSNPLDKKSNPLMLIKNQNVPLVTKLDPLAWMMARVSGIVAFVLFTLVVAFGLYQSSRAYIKIKILNAPMAQEIHRIISWVAFFVVILHFGVLFLDEYVQLKLSELLLPWTFSRNIKGGLDQNISLPVTFGIISFYIIVLLNVTSEIRGKIVSTKIWRIIHYISFLGYLLFLGHGIYSGTDTKQPWMIAIYAVSAILVFGLLLMRIFAKQLFMPKRKAPVAKPATQIPATSPIPDQKQSIA